MQIEKINENKIEVILTLEDFKETNVDLQAFMSSSIENQSIFSHVLHSASKKIGFDTKNCKVIVEAFSIPVSNSFLLIITKIPNGNIYSDKNSCLKLSHSKFGHFTFNSNILCCFNDFEDLCDFCNALKSLEDTNSSLYLFNNKYFLYIHIGSLKNLSNILYDCMEFADSLHIYHSHYSFPVKYQTLIKNSAIKTFQKYFA